MSYHPSARCHENWTRRLAERHRWLMTGPVTQRTGCVQLCAIDSSPPHPRAAPRARLVNPPRRLRHTPRRALHNPCRQTASIHRAGRTYQVTGSRSRIVPEIVANRSVFALVLILFLIITRLKAALIWCAHAVYSVQSRARRDLIKTLNLLQYYLDCSVLRCLPKCSCRLPPSPNCR